MYTYTHLPTSTPGKRPERFRTIQNHWVFSYSLVSFSLSLSLSLQTIRSFTCARFHLLVRLPPPLSTDRHRVGRSSSVCQRPYRAAVRSYTSDCQSQSAHLSYTTILIIKTDQLLNIIHTSLRFTSHSVSLSLFPPSCHFIYSVYVGIGDVFREFEGGGESFRVFLGHSHKEGV